MKQIPKQKKCPSCKKLLLSIQFYIYKAGLTSYCKKCTNLKKYGARRFIPTEKDKWLVEKMRAEFLEKIKDEE